jgi:hypothetical protein
VVKVGVRLVLEQEVKKGFGNPETRTLAIDNSEESQEAVKFVEKLGISYTIEHAKDVAMRDESFPNLLVGKNGTCLRGLEAIKFFRWDLQPTVKESNSDPEGAKKVIQKLREINEELKSEGFFERIKKEGLLP